MFCKEIVVLGGHLDINIKQIAYYLKNNKIPCDIIRYHIGDPIDLSFDINSLELKINGEVSNHKAFFYRHDVFSYLQENDRKLWDASNSIFETIRQYVRLRKDVMVLNKSFISRKNSKIFNLHQAKEVGFNIPKTLISSNIIDLKNFIRSQDTIQKPIDGGGFAYKCNLENFEGHREDFSHPYLVQEQLLQPEIRIYRIGKKLFPFQIIYDGVDYRKTEDTKVDPTEISDDIANKFIELSDNLHLDYAAGDFMTNSDGELTFLEINSSPMLARADEEVGGKICESIIDYLLS